MTELQLSPFTISALTTSEIDLLKGEIELQAQTIENLRKSLKEEVVVKSAIALKCPSCNAPLKVNSIKKSERLISNCEYCGCLIEFLTKE